MGVGVKGPFLRGAQFESQQLGDEVKVAQFERVDYKN